MFCSHLTCVHTPLTGIHQALTRSAQTAALLLAIALCGCPPERASETAGEPPGLTLPPPLVGAGADLTPAPPAAASLWKLPADTAGAPHLRLFYAQDARAEMEACGCPGAPAGGHARRATIVQDVRSWLPSSLVLEGPTSLSKAIGGTETLAPRDRARARAILGLLGTIGIDGFFPGQADFAALPPPDLAEAAEAAGVPVIVSNLAPALRPPSFRSALTWERDDQRVLILGLLGRPRSDLEQRHAPVTDVVAAVQSVVAEQGPADVVVAFTSADEFQRREWIEAGLPVDVLLAPFARPEDPAERWNDRMYEVRADPLGRALRRVDIVLSGRERGVMRRPEDAARLRSVASREGRWLRQFRTLQALDRRLAAGDDPRVRTTGLDGVERVDPATDPAAVRQALAQLRVDRDRDRAALAAGSTVRNLVIADLHALGESVPEDVAVAAAIDAYQAKWLDAITASAASEPVVEDGGYAGMDSCVECHPAINGSWPASAHGRAYRDLYERGEHRNPDCLGCHTTGFGEPGGFVDPTDTSLLNVQCEACHGPMGRHVRQAQRPGLRPSGGRPVTEAVCRTCHDAANSPRFDHAEYLSRIAHPGVSNRDGGGD